MNIFQRIASLFRRPPDQEITYHADYVCKLPYNWIPGDNILVDAKFTLEAIEEANYKECVERLNQGGSGCLHKTEIIENIEWTPLKITPPTWAGNNSDNYQRRKS